MIAVAAGSCGLAGFVPPLWAARQRPDDAAFRRRMHALAGGLFGLMVMGLVLVGVAGEDASGEPTGLVSDLGGALLLVNWLASIAIAVLVRNTRGDAELPGVAEELARRRLREQYRAVATRDPALARSLGIGRPDLPRKVDDGGLLDLNAIPANRLEPLAGLTAEEARRVAEARQQAGPFVTVDEMAVWAELPDSTVTMLRERAVFF